MLSAKLIKEIKKLEIFAKRQVNSSMMGGYRSAFRGQGMEFDEVRNYAPGDDVRAINWKVTARVGEPHVNVFKEERQLNVMVLVDVSASQYYSTSGTLKVQKAAELAAILAYLTSSHNDSIGLIMFTDQVEMSLPPKKSKSHVWNIIRTVLSYKPKGSKTNISAAIDAVLKMKIKNGMVFLLSDFISDGYEKSLQILSKKHDVVAGIFSDPSEKQLVPCGVVRYQDSESLASSRIYTSRSVVDKYNSKSKEWFDALNQKMAKFGVESFEITPMDSTSKTLSHFMVKRKRS